MKALIVTNSNNNIGADVDLQFTDRAQTYADDDGNLYHMNDFVEIDALDYEQEKADKMIDYYQQVSKVIQEFKFKEEQLEK